MTPGINTQKNLKRFIVIEKDANDYQGVQLQNQNNEIKFKQFVKIHQKCNINNI